MQYQSVLNSIARGMVAPVYLIYGDEEYLQERVINTFKEKLLTPDLGVFNLDELDGEKTTPGGIVSSANTLPVFAEKRLVIVKNPGLFHNSKKDANEEKTTKDEEILLKYLADPLISTCLVFWVKGSVDKRKKAVKAIQKTGAVLEFPNLKGSELANWLKEELRLRGKKLEARALEYIVINAGSNLRNLTNELDKLVLYAGEETTITLARAEEVITRTSEANIFTLVDSIGLKKGEPALTELRNVLSSGEPAVRVLFMIARQFRLLLRAKDLEKSGFTEKQITAELSLAPFVTGKILKQARNFSFAELEESLRQILQCDVAIKTGSPPRQTMEDLILKLVWEKTS